MQILGVVLDPTIPLEAAVSKRLELIDEGHEYGCECKMCRPDLWKPRETDWGKLTEAVHHAAFDHQTETHNRNEIWENFQLAEDRYQATAKRLDDALKALAAAVKQLEKNGATEP